VPAKGATHKGAKRAPTKPRRDASVVIPIRGTKRQRKARALDAQTATRRQRALALRMSGATYEAIGTTLGIATMTAWKHVQRALTETRDQSNEQADLLREQELARLDRIQLGFWTAAMRGNPAAADRVLRIMERRARLLGLDAPVRLAGEVGAPTEVHVRYVDEWQTD